VLGLASAADGDRLQALLQRFGLPTTVPAGLEAKALLARMRLDKKADAHGLRFVLWEGAGSARVVSGIDEGTVRAVLEAGA
jgi:3-dehydroquinate synthase